MSQHSDLGDRTRQSPARLTHPPGTSSLELKNVTAGYGKIPVLREVSLHVEPGEVVALFGANGAGKTTTLLTIAGEVRVTSGDVLLHGAPARGPLYKRAQARLGFVPEERSVLRKLTVGENLRLGGGDDAKIAQLAPELDHIKKRRAGLLSGGEQQILGLSRILARNPSVLLADELSLGLAPIVVARMLRAVRQAADSGVAVLLVEQHVEQALEYADRVYVMRRGRIQTECTAEELSKDRKLIESAYLGS